MRCQAALALDDQQLLARWIRAELDRVEGQLDKADRADHWLVEFYNDHEVKRAESLRWIGLAAAQYARWHRLSDQFDFLVNELGPDELKLDPAYWPSHFEAGILFLEKFNEADAAREFKAALELNPQAADVHAALAALALVNHNFEEAETSLHRAWRSIRGCCRAPARGRSGLAEPGTARDVAIPRRKGLAAPSRG